MAFEATNWAYRLKGLTITQKFVLVALADRADEDFSCYPSHTTVASMISSSPKTVERAVFALEQMGLLERERRNDAKGYRTSDRYRLKVGAQPKPLTDNLSVRDDGPNRQPGPSYQTMASDAPLINHQSEPSDSSSEASGSDVVDVREDVELLCTTLRDLIIRNGNRPPTITGKWRDEARRLLDRDKIPLGQALTVLRWSQQDSFWRSNILSMPTFRAKFDQLRSRAATLGALGGGGPGRRLTNAERNMQEFNERYGNAAAGSARALGQGVPR